MKTDTKTKNTPTGVLVKAMQRLMNDGTYPDNLIVPYWLDTPRDVGFGFIKITMKNSKPRSESYYLSVEELEWNTENRKGGHDDRVKDFSHFAENPFKYLKFDENGDVKPRRIDFVERYSQNPRYPYGNGIIESGQGGLLSYIFKSIKESAQNAGDYSFTPGYLYLSSTKESLIRVVLAEIISYLKGTMHKNEIVPCVGIFC